MYFTKQRRGVCISRQYATSRPAAENTNHQRTSRQGHQGKNRRVSTSIDHTTGAPSTNAGTSPDARREKNERGGGQMRDSQWAMDVRGSSTACGGYCKSVVISDRPARYCAAVSCHLVGFVLGCGQVSRMVLQSEGGGHDDLVRSGTKKRPNARSCPDRQLRERRGRGCSTSSVVVEVLSGFVAFVHFFLSQGHGQAPFGFWCIPTATA